MKRLRPTDGTPVHRRAARYHQAKCTLGTVPFHKTLEAAEVGLEYKDLVTKARATEDLLVAADAGMDAAELHSSKLAARGAPRRRWRQRGPGRGVEPGRQAGPGRRGELAHRPRAEVVSAAPCWLLPARRPAGFARLEWHRR